MDGLTRQKVFTKIWGRGVRLSKFLADVESTFSGRWPATPALVFGYVSVGWAYTTLVRLQLLSFYHVRPEVEFRGLVKRWRCARIGYHEQVIRTWAMYSLVLTFLGTLFCICGPNPHITLVHKNFHTKLLQNILATYL